MANQTAAVRPPGKPSRLVVAGLGLIVPASVLLAWQVLGDRGIISDMLFPTPAVIAKSFAALVASGDLWGHLRISLIRVLSGFLLGGGLGLVFGILVGLFKRSEKLLDPTLQMIRMIPSLAVVPLFIIWFGIGEESKVLIIAKGAVFPLYINTFLGIRSVDNKLFEVSRVLGFSRLKQVIRLVLPGATPSIFLGLRLSLGLSWLGLVVAELIASTEGIGYMMSDARQFADTPVVFVGIFIFALGGLLSDVLVRLAERRLLGWKTEA
ncbi:MULTISPECIES: ABC transporter permease [unclassified Paenibacillus]|uniref:ABC transporter permease n=1 Tax=unclassified Paenibacillus TaxID=185978 RepID=UPI0024063012|nr:MULTISPECIES: ABC transporter permease [unclassified Paenibacillus]MDF9844569.1 sulfonate transport system permease protein [Paenibacillus sp. PastF-2]MDF9851146.1 sulfonate transport system permease protein [Paenibacillus sp. PastM-2]MDF9856219.1 sulfonate transport system permease protein [Paenibacillus sp. PastF-1]MDH6481552.1 sulfonate transport system permease protein [Paenibacillus sp. PastH-2]MDH6510434.1 sulfonate transport system permease protein [Paenibacillus sp. PastM-3]